MKRKGVYIRFVSVLALGLFLGMGMLSCGGGGGGPAPQPQPPPQPTATYLYYFNRTTGGLFFYDPVTKATTTVEASGITGGESEFIGGTYSAAASQLTDVHFNTMVYAKNDGKLYKVSLLKSGTHTPVQVSNETGASTICNNQDIPDIANPDDSIYAYELPGTDGLCNPPNDTDNVWKAVRLSSSPITMPMEITSLGMEPVTEISDWPTAGLVGELAVDHLNEALVKCTTDFTSAKCADILLNAPTFTVKNAGSLGIDINAKKIYLWVSNGTEYQVRTYDTVNDIISDPVYTTTNAIVSPGLQDSGAAYFAELPSTLKKITFGPTPEVVLLFTETTGYYINGLLLTDNRIVYTDYDQSLTEPTYTLRSALKSGGTPAVLAEAIYPATLQLAVVTGNGVFYNLASGSTYTAGYIKDDGTGRHEVLNARWTAASYSTTMEVASGTVDLAKVIMSKSNGEVRSFDAMTYSSSSTGLLLGAMPTGDPDYMYTFYGGGIGNDILGAGYNSAGKGDIFSVNVNTVGSLYRVTSTADDEGLARW